MDTQDKELNQFLKALYDELDEEFDIDRNFQKADYDYALEDNLTPEQRKRDSQITFLLSEFVNNYRNKASFILEYREKTINCFTSIAAILIVTFLIITFVMLTDDNNSWVDFAGYISAYAGLIGLFVGIIKIMVEFIFPKDDEQHITNIVKSIQENDLENKKENVKAKHHNE